MPEEDYIPLSALQHYVFCPRQCALIHNECLWKENVLTTLGRQEHERVDTAPDSLRGGVYTARAVPLVSHRWGIRGISDVVEYVREGREQRITPVEYKHGQDKTHEADRVQLCAQALCLEEMHACRIEFGYLFYHQPRRRQKVQFDEQLRATTIRAIENTRSLMEERALPATVRRRECAACSLYEICLPSPDGEKASAYNERLFRSFLTSDETAS